MTAEKDFDVILSEPHVWTVGYVVGGKWRALEDFDTRSDAEHCLEDIQRTGLYVDRSEPLLYTVYDVDGTPVQDFQNRQEALVWAHERWQQI